MIAILGDWHLSSSKDYHIAIANRSIEWFSSWDKNRAGNELIHVGDLVNNAVNAGQVLDFVEEIIRQSRFDHIHIIPGNHDIKRRDGFPQLAYQFLKHRDNVTIHSRANVSLVQGKKVLFMPHFIPGAFEASMREAYSNAYKSFTDEYDLVVGHFNDDTVGMHPSSSIMNLEKLKTKHLCLGHIHTRIHPSRYIGSLFATRVNETEPNRSAWLIHDDGTKTEEPLPVFSAYQTVEYPNPLPEPEGLVNIYTITNCPSEQVAREHYKDSELYIRKIVRPLTPIGAVESVADIDVYSMSMAALFREFQKTAILDRRVSSLCTSLVH